MTDNMHSLEIIYGVNPAFEVLRAGRRRVERAWLAVGAGNNARLRRLGEMLTSAGAKVEQAGKDILIRHSQTREHQGVVLEVSPYPYISFEELLGEPRLLLLDNVEDPQNVGAILRSAEVFGWSAVLLAAKGVPPVYSSVVKASAGATEHLRICRELPANSYVRQALASDFTVLALDSRGKDDLMALATSLPEKMLLVIGGEHYAVGQYILNQANHVLSIPQRGRVQSLNASVAAGIALCMLGYSPRIR